MASTKFSAVPVGPTPLAAKRTRTILFVFSASLFLSSVLLFSVQPMFTKMVLPLLGGSPAVWNTAVVFFQATLLSGYLYAHVLSRFLSLKVQAFVHFSLFLCAITALPVAVATGWEPPVDAMPTLWLIGLMAVSIGLPLLVVSASAPLLQSWFSLSGHRYAADPYFLYGASNLGSILALAGYVTLIAPSIGLEQQGQVWAWGFALLALLVCLCAVTSSIGGSPDRQKTADAVTTRLVSTVNWGQRLRWLLLSFAPASLMLGVTLHISTDVAAAPFLWVIPLALYLLTFVFVFARKPVLKHNWMLQLQIFVLIPLAVYFSIDHLWLVFLLHLSGLFVTAMVCHGELVKQRPVTEHLTEFYLWMSLGGFFGGVFSSLLAPLLFDTVVEYPVALIIACLLRPVAAKGPLRARILDVALPIGLGLLMLLRYMPSNFSSSNYGEAGHLIFVAVVALVLFVCHRRPMRFGLGIAAVLLVPALATNTNRVITQERSFFGVYSVLKNKTGQFHKLRHGTTTHGVQIMDAMWRRRPLSYYSWEGPLGQLFTALNRQYRLTHIAAVGLGIGTIACYRRPGQNVTFYEIDPTVERLARNPRLFGYLTDCNEGVWVKLGDGRRGISSAPDGKFDLIVLDAFVSDAIPLHLITREAIALYQRKLSDRGIIAFHISNRFVDLAPVLANLVADAGFAARIQRYTPTTTRGTAIKASTWVAIGRMPRDLAFLANDSRWQPLEKSGRGRPWTDDYSDVFSALIWGRNFMGQQSRGPELLD